MSADTPIHTLLAADATLTTLLTGGVLLRKNMSSNGLARKGTPSAYDSVTGLLKPVAVVRGRAVVPTGDLRDGKYTSTRQVVEIWLYNDQSAGWAVLDQASDRIYSLLQDEQVDGTFQVSLVNLLDYVRAVDEAEELENACMKRLDFECIGRKS